MTTMTRFGLAALFAIGVALVASSPVRAQEGEDWGTIDLGPTSAEPGASGQATLTNVNFLGWFVTDKYHLASYSGDLSMTCQGLKPNATYNTSVGSRMKSGRDGTLQGAMHYKQFYIGATLAPSGTWIPVNFNVAVERAHGSRDLVLIGSYAGSPP